MRTMMLKDLEMENGKRERVKGTLSNTLRSCRFFLLAGICFIDC